MTAVRIRKYKIGQRGLRGLMLTIPADMGFALGMTVSLYRGKVCGKDVLLVSPGDDDYITDEA